MANTREAFERLLSTIPKFEDFGKDFNSKRVMDYYTALERVNQSDLFMEDLLMKRLDKVATSQYQYDGLYIKIKYIGKLIDDLYDLKYH
jgi:hypothetical protein